MMAVMETLEQLCLSKQEVDPPFSTPRVVISFRVGDVAKRRLFLFHYRELSRPITQ